MTHFKWIKVMPAFTEECLLLVAQYIGKKDRDYENRQYETTLFEIKQLDGENDKGEPAWYWGVLCSDGEEWGDLDDLHGSLYMTLPLLKGAVDAVVAVQVSDTTGSDSSNAADNPQLKSTNQEG